jgi:hypothetical protein
MDAATAVTANFRTQYTITAQVVATTDQTSGIAGSNPPGLACLLTAGPLKFNVCTGYFEPGTAVTLSATPGNLSQFLGWGGDCAGLGTCSLTITRDFAVMATFGPAPPPDGINNTFGSAIALGNLNCGLSATQSGTTSPAGTEDWLQFTWVGGCTATLTLTASSGIQFDVNTDSITSVVSAVTTSTTLTIPGTYYIRIYGATSTTTGTWAMAVSVP